MKQVILNELKEISLEIDNRDINDEIGKNGIAKFLVNQGHYDFNSTVGKWKSIFQLKIVDENNVNYKVGCGPWKKDINFYILCELNETIPKGKYIFKFNKNENKFNYSGYAINLYFYSYFEITKIDSNIIDLYSPPQTINVTDNEDIYELKFNIISYNQEKIYWKLYYSDFLDCRRENDELICPIKKTALVSDMSEINLDMTKNDGLEIYFLNQKGEFIKFPLISLISINYAIHKKIDVYVKITKLLTNYVVIFADYNYIVYETNVTNIPSVDARCSVLNFIGKKEEHNLYCRFRKGEKSAMLILCQGLYHEDVLYLKEIKSNIIVDDVNIQYNFIIIPVNNQEKTTLIKNNYYYDYPTNIIYQIFPNILNFTSNDSLEIDLYLEKPRDVNGITFNE